LAAWRESSPAEAQRRRGNKTGCIERYQQTELFNASVCINAGEIAVSGIDQNFLAVIQFDLIRNNRKTVLILLILDTTQILILCRTILSKFERQ
jgi:hypothetical protein